MSETLTKQSFGIEAVLKELGIKENNYGKYDANAGLRRNKQMAEYADMVLVLEPNGDTPGSSNCASNFKKLQKTVHVYYGEKQEKTEGKYKF